MRSHVQRFVLQGDQAEYVRQQAERAQAALRVYCSDPNEDAFTVADFVVALRHLLDARADIPLDWYDVERAAQMHYTAEIRGEF